MANKFHFKTIAVCIFILFFGAQVHAQEKAFVGPPIRETWEQKALDGNIRISRWFDRAAEWVDLFVSGKRVTTRRNETNVRIENSSIYKEGIGYTNSTSFNLNLRLPNVEEYWNLKFTSYDEEADKRKAESAQYRQRPQEKNYGATIGFFRKLGNIRAAFQPRIDLGNPLKVSHTMTLTTTTDITPAAQMSPKIELFANSDSGTGVFDQLNFGIQLSPVYQLALVNQSKYEDKIHLFQVSQGIAISRNVMKDAAISYSIFFNSDNQTTYHLANYSVGTTWSHMIYDRILDYNVSPHVDFLLDSNFTGRFGLNFNLNLQF